MTERSVTFGSHGGLVGIVTEPGENAPTRRRAVLMSNVGMHHRVGPYRLYVDLARHFAARGWHVMRFDLSGMGDSEPRPGTQSDAERASLDVAEAMDLLQDRYGIETFVLLGLCSGVDSTHAVTVSDPRVNGAIFIDGYTYATPGFRLRRYSLRYLQAKRWTRFAQRKLSDVRAREAASAEPDPAEYVFTREYPSLERFRRDVLAVAARGTRMLFIYTGSVDYRYNARTQLFEQLGGVPRGGRITVGYLREVDHLFSSIESRRSLLAHLDGWFDAFEAEERTRVSITVPLEEHV